LRRDLVICIDFSGNRERVYGLVAARKGDLARLAALLPLFPHYSDIKTKLSKKKSSQTLPQETR